MSQLANEYSLYSIHKMLVDHLEEDGVLCNNKAKYYDELGTYKGGANNRLAFKNYNDKITRYHALLAAITGEQRANIYEAIPVIDFLNIENTSFLSTYQTTNDIQNPIDPSVIEDIPNISGKSVLSLLEEEDPYTINRAVMGLDTALHFYNTTDTTSGSDYNIQVSPYQASLSSSFIYKGVYGSKILSNNEVYQDKRQVNSLLYIVQAYGHFIFNPDNSNNDLINCIKVQDLNSDTISYILKDRQDIDQDGITVLNTDCGYSTPGYIFSTVTVGGQPIISQDTAQTSFYKLAVNPDDIIIALPTTVYSSDPTKILYLRCNDVMNDSSGTAVLGTFSDEEKTKFIPQNPDYQSESTLLFYAVKEDEGVYTFYKYMKDSKKAYYALQTEDVISFKSEGAALEKGLVNVYLNKASNYYTPYLIYISNFTGFDVPTIDYDLVPGEEFPMLGHMDELQNVLKNYINLKKYYYSKASGLLNGYFCEPYILEETSTGKTVKKWAFVNDCDLAASKGITIDIGSHYNSGHILYRGNILESPLHLTPHDTVIINGATYVYKDHANVFAQYGINGKAEVYFNNLLQNNETFLKTFNSAKMDTKTWQNQSIFGIGSLITKFDYTPSKFGKDTAKILSAMEDPYGNSSAEYINNMVYSKKFTIDNVVIGEKEISEYIDAFIEGISDDGKTLSLTTASDYVISDHSIKENKKSLIFEGIWGSDTVLSAEVAKKKKELEENPKVCYFVNYTIRKKGKKKDKGKIENNFENPWVYAISPFELFAKKNYDTNTILVYPEYKDKFPQKLYLLSRENLHLDVSTEAVNYDQKSSGLCTLYTAPNGTEPGKMLMFRVSAAKKAELSKIRTLNLTDDEGFHSANFSFSKTTSLGLKVPTIGTAAGILYGSPLVRTLAIGNTLVNAVTEKTVVYNEHDCYIYELAPISISYEDSGITLYNKNDELIPFSEIEDNCNIIAASYPKTYFPVQREDKGQETAYKLISKNRAADFISLENAAIIPGLPNFNSISDLQNIAVSSGAPNYIKRLFAESFADMLYNETTSEDSVYRTITKRILSNSLQNWEISDSLINPIRLKDVSKVVSSLKSFTNNIDTLASAGFRIWSDNAEITLTGENFKRLKERINKTQEYKRYTYEVCYQSLDGYTYIPCDSGSIVPEEPIEVYYQWHNKMYEQVSLLPGTDLTGYYVKVSYDLDLDPEKSTPPVIFTPCDTGSTVSTKTARAYYSWNTETKMYDTVILQPGAVLDGYYSKSLPDTIKARLAGLQIIPHEQKTTKTYFTFDHIQKAVENLFEDGTISLDDCKDIDLCFGNDTAPFLNIGDTMGSQVISAEVERSMAEAFAMAGQVIKDTSQEIIDNTVITVKQSLVGELRSKFQVYFNYNDDEILKVIDDNGNISTKYLIADKINFNTSATRTLIDHVRKGTVRTTAITLIGLGFLFTPVLSFVAGVLALLRWRRQSLNDFIADYQLVNNPGTIKKGFLGIHQAERNYICRLILREILAELDSDVLYFKQKVQQSLEDIHNIVMLDEVVQEYIEGKGLVYDFDNAFFTTIRNPSGGYLSAFNVICPEFTDNFDLIEPEEKDKYTSITTSNVIAMDIDISRDVLSGIASFIKTSLEGTDPDGKQPSYIKYIANEDSTLVGRSNGLYYKRYQMLNNRINKLHGSLYQAAALIRNSKTFTDSKNMGIQFLKSYDRFIQAIPIAEVDPLTYLPEQQATMTSIPLAGKFYHDSELEALRSLINSSCILTCTRCSVKDSCPFYNQEEVIKLYCTGAETIDFYIKDNELNLLEDTSLTCTNKEGVGFNPAILETVHFPYADITTKIDTNSEKSQFEVNNLKDIKIDLKNHLDTNNKQDFSKYVRDDLGWLLGGRYGTLEKNNIIDLIKDAPSSEYYKYIDSIHPYKYLYDAIFIKMKNYDSLVNKEIPVSENDSYIMYAPSSVDYPVNLDITKDGENYHYEGTTKVKIPFAIKLLKDANLYDDLYLVSDDERDLNGQSITPVIYLGKVGDVQWTFDLTDDGNLKGIQDPKDTKLYAKDVAQWCVNYYKGNLIENPLGPTNENRDQYWMETVYKKITDEAGKESWISVPGRKRISNQYQEPVMDENTYDEISAISGHPVVNSYVNFVRKVSIRIYDPTIEDETQRWLIKWVNPNMVDKFGKALNEETQRSILPLMKTNVRLVLVKASEN